MPRYEVLNILHPESVDTILAAEESARIGSMVRDEIASLGSDVFFKGEPLLLAINISENDSQNKEPSTRSGRLAVNIGNNVTLNSANLGSFNCGLCKITIVSTEYGTSGKVTIGDGSTLQGTQLISYKNITIGRNVLFGPNVIVMDSHGHPIQGRGTNSEVEMIESDAVVIGDNCWIGYGAMILPGVTIGDNCVIGAHSVVTESIGSNSVGAGVPCKVIKSTLK